MTRLLDILFATMLLIALAILITDGGPVFYAQQRIGRHGRTFPCLKFRSMVTNSAERLELLLSQDPGARAEWDRDHKLRNDPRTTRLGILLRKTSLDELPQVFNILWGHMSMVGPRPIVTGEMWRYGRYFNAYCAQRPGLTGLWQVSGRSDTAYRRRVALDVAYSRQKCVPLYIWILFKTVPAVLSSRGSY